MGKQTKIVLGACILIAENKEQTFIHVVLKHRHGIVKTGIKIIVLSCSKNAVREFGINQRYCLWFTSTSCNVQILFF